MFSQFRNIDTAFKHIRTFSFLLIFANVFVICFVLFQNKKVTDAAAARIYILHNGKVLRAVASDRKSNIPVELRDHIKSFHDLFFNLSPDDKAIRAAVGKAMYLADESAKKEYDNLRESGYYNNLISANISKDIQVDSIQLSMEDYPYRFKLYATEKLVRSSGTALRKLITQGAVYDLNEQTDDNPHGFMIRNWEILRNEDLPFKHTP